MDIEKIPRYDADCPVSPLAVLADLTLNNVPGTGCLQGMYPEEEKEQHLINA